MLGIVASIWMVTHEDFIHRLKTSNHLVQQNKQYHHHKLLSLRRSFLHFHFISGVHIWFISYIINTHFFHGNIWTHNWPAPNVSGFIAQLVRASHRYREVTGSNPVEVLNFCQASLRNCINCFHCDDHFYTFKQYHRKVLLSNFHLNGNTRPRSWKSLFSAW